MTTRRCALRTFPGLLVTTLLLAVQMRSADASTLGSRASAAIPTDKPNWPIEHGNCRKVGTGVTCTCDVHWTYSEADAACKETNYCSDGTGVCSPAAECTPTSGGVSCRCLAGFQGNGFQCRNTACDDRSACPPNAKCWPRNGVNATSGKASPDKVCVCEPGFTGSGDGGKLLLGGTSCTPIEADACADIQHNCGANADCTPLSRGRVMCRCKSGYEDTSAKGGGKNCMAVNPCTQDGAEKLCLASMNKECVYKGPGKHACECVEHFAPVTADDGVAKFNGATASSLAEKVYACKPIDYCKAPLPPGHPASSSESSESDGPATDQGPCHKQAKCYPRRGGVACICNGPRWEGDGRTCTATNICATKAPFKYGGCSVDAACTYGKKSGKVFCQCNTGFCGNGKTCEAQSIWSERRSVLMSAPRMSNGTKVTLPHPHESNAAGGDTGKSASQRGWKVEWEDKNSPCDPVTEAIFKPSIESIRAAEKAASAKPVRPSRGVVAPSTGQPAGTVTAAANRAFHTMHDFWTSPPVASQPDVPSAVESPGLEAALAEADRIAAVRAAALLNVTRKNSSNATRGVGAKDNATLHALLGVNTSQAN